MFMNNLIMPYKIDINLVNITSVVAINYAIRFALKINRLIFSLNVIIYFTIKEEN